MIEENLPKHDESQQIGRLACLAFDAVHPINWLIKDTEGVDDAGLDKQVQFVEDNKYSTVFHVQVKGSRQSKNSNNKKLSKDGTFFSVLLEIRTLNYYARIESPVMLAFADLTANPDPRQCPVYYLWIDEEIDKLLTNHENLDYLGKKSHTFRIPTKNILDGKLDVSSYLNKRIAIRKAIKRIVGAVEEKYPEVVHELSQLGSRLSSGYILESVLHSPEKLWGSAPEGSFARSLNKIATYLETNKGNIATRELDNLNSRLRKANQHEKAEYYHLKAKTITLVGDYKKALNMHQKAQQLMPKDKKYNLAFVEAQANLNYNKPKLCEKLIKETDGKEEIEYTRLRAKLLALSGQPQEAIRLLSKEKEKDIVTVKALIYILSKDYRKCKHVCSIGLKRRSLPIKARMFLLCLKARVLFIEGMGKEFKSGVIIKFCGLPGMDVKILKECWSDVLEAWRIACDLGYPIGVDYIADISSLLSIFFGNTDLLFDYLKDIARIRTSCHEIQEALFIMALHLNDEKVVKEQIKKLPLDPTRITGEIFLYYQQGERGRTIDVILENIAELEKANVENYDTILLIGAECTNEQFRDEELTIFLNKIKLLPNSKDILACYRFYETINNNVLDKKKAVEELYNAFKGGCKDKQVQAQLLMHLDIHEKIDANKTLKVVEETLKERHLFEREIVRVCEARITLEQWDEAIELLDSAQERFGENSTLLALRALVFDSSGNTPKALNILDEIIERGSFEPRVAEVTSQIAGRCGLANKAKKLYTRLLSQERERTKQIEILNMLFKLEAGINPESPQLLKYCQQYGKLSDQTNESEEGSYLQMVFMTDVLTKHKPTEQEKLNFQKRLDNYIKKFPESNYLKAVHYDPKDKAQNLLEEISKVTGMTNDVRNWYTKNENLMQSGELVLPFAIRPNYLLNVGDFPYLWELSKYVSKDTKQYNLVMSIGHYDYRDTAFVKRTPLLDEVSLVILNDLKLLKKIFILFNMVAITKPTLLRIQNWKQGFLCSCPKKAKEIADTLSTKIEQILQPACECDNFLRVGFRDLDGYKMLVNKNRFLFYSDCAFTRLYVCGETEKTDSISTLDIIKSLRDAKDIKPIEGAKIIAKLSKWNVIGVCIDYIDDILTVLEPSFKRQEKCEIRVEEAIKILNTNKDFDALISGMWFFNRDYFSSVAEIGKFIAIMVGEVRTIKVDASIIVAIWHKWYEKICLTVKGESSKLRYFARSFVSASINLIIRLKNTNDFIKYSSRLWSIYRDVVKYSFGNEMDEEVESEMLTIPAQFIAEVSEMPVRDKALQFISAGITDGTMDSEIFAKASFEAILKKSGANI